ncbi:MAG: MgtC/SapB family protein [Rhizobiaceae bacterium]|jgi:putative Mg2+ transporter-C (MgtC) family protein|nr:MgtC/SapB family protein [Rhizobiaceae bacterium]
MSFENWVPEYVADGQLAMVCVRLLGAALLSSVIGFERESRDHAAGLRTNMLVGVASASFALVTLLLLEASPHLNSSDNVLRLDPIRLIEAVTGGVAFLAAGVIIFTRGRVHGLTTGASMWLSAAIGLSAGLGYWVVAIPAAVTGLVILTAIRLLEKKLGIRGTRNYSD